jgi:carbamoyltransferase
MKRNYIGLATSVHDPAIAVVNSKGEVVFAEAIERYAQSKRAILMSPDQFIYYISHLIKTYVEPGAKLVVAHSWSDRTLDLRVQDLDHCEQIINEVPQVVKLPLLKLKFFLRNQILLLQKAGENLEFIFNYFDELKEFSDFQVRKYDHHLAHAASACFTSPFSEACCALLDGHGETRSYNCFHYKEGKIVQLPGIIDGHGSLGFLYSDICDTCGFDSMGGEEWKVMGLAAYGKYDQEIYDIFKSTINVDGLNLQEGRSNEQLLYQFINKKNQITRKKSEPAITAANIAYTGQQVFIDILFEYLNNLYQLGLSDNLIMGGGCCLNSSANGMITEKTGFKNFHVFSAPADDGNAIGAALLAYYEDHPKDTRSPGFQSPYLGSEFSDNKLEHLKLFGNFRKVKHCPDDIHYQAAKLLADGKIIGWVQGKAEYGPRALGNRSILADPRSPNIKEIINDRVKFREEFRPLAPSILDEFGPEYFENYQEAPYMERTLRFKEAVKHRVPGVVHEDGTGRLQSVKKEWNERYYNLIHAFYQLTGVPLVLNTSFNVMGKPIIHSVEDAIAVFYTTGLDALVIGDLLIEK